MKVKNPHLARTVLVVLDISYLSAREQLSGIYRFQRTHDDWNIRLIPSNDPRFQPAISQSVDEGIEGAIIKTGSALDLSPLIVSHVPLAVLERPSRELACAGDGPARPLAVISIDNAKIGTLAADHLVSLGNYATYVYVADQNDNEWSRLRGKSFTAALRRHGRSAVNLTMEELCREIQTLSKPIAMFAAFDLLASDVMKVCRCANLSVPRDAVVLGVDNDPNICENTLPPLSSIRIDFEKQGYAAAEALDSLMSGKSAHRTITLPPGEVIVRSSTTNLPPARTLVDRAMKLVEMQSTKGVRVLDISRQLGVSPSLLKTRFRQLKGHSIRDELISARLLKVHGLLQTTQYPIGTVAKMCGFSSSCILDHLFKKKYGCSPSSLRNRRTPCQVPI